MDVTETKKSTLFNMLRALYLNGGWEKVHVSYSEQVSCQKSQKLLLTTLSYQESDSTSYSCSMLLESLWEAKVETPEKDFEFHQ